MKFLSLQNIRKKVNEMGKKIDVSKKFYPTFGESKDFAYPNIEVRDDGYHYIVIERGDELEHRKTLDIDELLYWIFEYVTFEIACEYELNHRKDNQDSRRMLFTKQLELLSIIDQKFFEECRRKLDKILEEHPFVDKNGSTPIN